MKNIEIIIRYQSLNSISTAGFDVPKLKKVLGLRKELLKKNEEYNELRREIFKSYGIEWGDTQLSIDEANKKYDSMPNKKEVVFKVQELDNEIIELNGVANFLSEDDVIKCALGKNPLEVELLLELLVVK